ncbi:5'/3'-nucleotidase SurE [Halosimplex halophilum]|uniref:5'/3'-nucleotidase SurE n=1 Tax=Halosimplex halophilum TaxID=2559572 RepID=UPI00107F5482|nr:5'/3'-nucleotidase SurE [Halosimplex halophilum]
MDEPHVLLTNDDGIDSLGLACLYERLAESVAVTVVAPAEDHSGLGRKNSYAVEVRDHEWGRVVEGTPADCVAYGLRGLAVEPDLVVSGPNPGPNIALHRLGRSGTVGAAIEAAHLGTPAIAVSAYDPVGGEIDDPTAESFARTVEFTAGLAERLPGSGAFDAVDYLTVHVPTERAADPQVRLTRPNEAFDVTVSEDGTTARIEDRSYDPLRKDRDVDFPPGETDTDRRALADGDVSVSPLRVTDRVVESAALADALDGLEVA